ncbi:hypothetical protein GO730_27685 [Spirosoma sp. HMF3257]|uniref:Uncharacterized protein n=1 Tax=Spirosoma telluris TaxID=2183553 RepID=A0A327NST1_9BACT|nr:hypothetical protein [Spirosoma telluris]RAI77006.1 hypothetical protein HMF3257_27615 [Spirosoma telluris]
MTTTTGTYRPIPIGELLEMLRNDGFQITPDSYRRVFAVVNTFFPDGLPVDAADQPIESARQELCQLLGPVLVRNETEQERFAKQFHQLVIERATAPPQPPYHLLLRHPQPGKGALFRSFYCC